MNNERWLVIGAFATVYFVWGSTYLANYWAIESIPPFLMCGGRFAVAGLLLYGYLKLSMPSLPTTTLKQWANAGLVGVLFLAIGTGAAVWALQFIPTSLASLIIAFNPLLIMLLIWIIDSRKPQIKALLGAGVSIVGMGLLVGQSQLNGSADSIKGLLAIFAAMLSWAFASIYAGRLDMGKHQVRATAMQMTVGGAVILIFASLKGELASFSFSQVEDRSWGAVIYLIFFGSILTFSAFNFLLSRVSPEKVATNTYVNPLVAIVLGGWLNDELITKQSILAGVIMLTGVYFINSSKQKQ